VRAQPKHDIVTVEVTDHVRDVVALFKKHGISQLPVLDQGRLAGILTETDVLEHLVWATADSDTSVAEVMVRRISTVSLHASASELPQIFERGEVAIVVDDEGQMVALITKLDLIDLLAGRKVAK
jgi:cystathionine beta-synthase